MKDEYFQTMLVFATICWTTIESGRTWRISEDADDNYRLQPSQIRPCLTWCPGRRPPCYRNPEPPEGEAALRICCLY